MGRLRASQLASHLRHPSFFHVFNYLIFLNSIFVYLIFYTEVGGFFSFWRKIVRTAIQQGLPPFSVFFCSTMTSSEVLSRHYANHYNKVNFRYNCKVIQHIFYGYYCALNDTIIGVNSHWEGLHYYCCL